MCYTEKKLNMLLAYGLAALIQNVKGEVNAMYRIELLERKRLKKGLSYTEIADKLGMHKVTVSRTLKGTTLKPRTVKLLADYLGVEMDRIVQ